MLTPPSDIGIGFSPVIKWQIIGKNSNSYEGINDTPVVSID